MVMSETVVRRMVTTLQTTMRPCWRMSTRDVIQGCHICPISLQHFGYVFRSLNDGTESRPSQVFEAGQRGVDEESDDQKEYAAVDGDAQTLPSL